MGLFDRFKKNNKPAPDNRVDPLVEKADKLVEEMKKEEDQAKNEMEQIIKIRTERAKKEEHYKALMSRIAVLRRLDENHKIVIVPSAYNKVLEWCKTYKEQMQDYDYRYSDLVIPSFPLDANDILYPKRDYPLLNCLEQLLNENDDYRRGNEIVGGIEEIFKAIQSNEELVTVQIGRDIHEAHIEAFNAYVGDSPRTK